MDRNTGIVWARCQGHKGHAKDRILYRLYPPKDRTFFPTDESIKTIIAKTKLGIAFERCSRRTDTRGSLREVLYVSALEPTMFTRKASPILQKKRDAFLRALARACRKSQASLVFDKIEAPPKVGRV